MAKLKYDRPIVVAVDSSSVINVPNDEVWKVSVYHNGSSPYSAPESLYADGSTRIQIIGGGETQRSGVCHRHRLQAHRRVNGPMEVILHG